ncbi:PKD domain-containing protein, partial [Bacteroides xylanisolvens]
MNKVTYLVSLICILLFSSCEEDKVYYNTAAKADFTIGEDMYELGQTAVFKDASIPDEGNQIVSWLWEFGDAAKSVSMEQNPTFIYQSDGTFTIKLTVTDNNGLRASAKKDLTILDPAKAINVMWQKEMGGPIENTVSPALSADGKTVYMITDQTSTGAFDVKLFAYDTSNGAQRWAFDVTAKMNELNPGGGASMVYA